MKNAEERIKKARDFIFQYGGIDGTHHKDWVIDQFLRIILEDEYSKFIEEYIADDYEWEEGIAP